MSSVSIEEARAKLSELIHELHPGDEVVIIKNEQPVAASGVRRRRRGTDDEMLLQIDFRQPQNGSWSPCSWHSSSKIALHADLSVGDAGSSIRASSAGCGSPVSADFTIFS